MAGRQEIKFTQERRTFFSKKASQEEGKPTPPTVVIAPVTTTTTQQSKPAELLSPTVQPVNQPPAHYQPLSAGRPQFKNSHLPSNPPTPTITPQQVTSPSLPAREKMPDEVAINFDPSKYKIVNPTLKFEYRRTQIELKLGHIDQEEGEVMTVFVGPDYKDSKEVAKLAQLCEYDIVKCITDCKPRNGKVIPLTSKSFDRFSGLFVVYLEERFSRNDLLEALANLFKQVSENEVEELCVQVPKGKLYSGTADELANVLLDEAISFLSNRSRDNPPTQISWLQYITDEPVIFSELTKAYAEAVDKAGSAQNLMVIRNNA